MIVMKRLQAFKFQLRPNGQQERDMRRFAGACRFVFNRALALQNENHEAGNKYIPYTKMASWLIEWKSHPDTQWLKDAITAVAAVTERSGARLQKFLPEACCIPSFQETRPKRCIPLPARREARSGQQSYISLPKLGWVRYRNSREVIGEVKNVTVSLSCDKWYVSIQTEYEVADPVHNAESMVGLDAGVTK
ncbi:Helix-turn-helix domain [Klebsiella pneumoniae]|nr:Helix-turn-helix domain [Klebsiella pneumoniae]